MPPLTNEKELAEPQLAFDGSPMPTVALPQPPQKTIDQYKAAITRMEQKKLTLKGLIYGDVGTRKTTTAMKILQGVVPTDKDILYIDTAEGWSILQNWPELMDRSLHMPFENIEQVWGLADLIKSGAEPFDKIGGIIFDEYTGMHDDDLNWIVQARADQMAKKGEFKDPFSPALPDYNAARIRSNRLISKFMRLPNTHFIFIGHEKEDKRKNKVPDMPEKAGKSVYQKMHFAYHAHWESNGQLVLQTTGNKMIMAKNRINGIEAFTNPEQVVDCYNKWGVKAPVVTTVEPVSTEAEESLLKILE
jgi:hypothetical protein